MWRRVFCKGKLEFCKGRVCKGIEWLGCMLDYRISEMFYTGTCFSPNEIIWPNCRRLSIIVWSTLYVSPLDLKIRQFSQWLSFSDGVIIIPPWNSVYIYTKGGLLPFLKRIQVCITPFWWVRGKNCQPSWQPLFKRLSVIVSLPNNVCAVNEDGMTNVMNLWNVWFLNGMYSIWSITNV